MFTILKKMHWRQMAILGSVLAICLNPSVAQVPLGGAIYLGGNQNLITVLDSVTLKSIATITIPDVSSIDYLRADSMRRKLYGIAHSAGSPITSSFFIVDIASNKVISIIRSGLDIQGIGLLPDANKIYVNGNKKHASPPDDPTASSDDAVVNVLDTRTLQPLKQVVVASWIDANYRAGSAIAVSPDGARVYAGNSNSRSIAVIDTKTDTALATIDMSAIENGYPSCIAVTPDGSMVFVGTMSRTGEGPGKMVVIDTVDCAINEIIDLPGIDPKANSMCFFPGGEKMYVANDYADYPLHKNGVIVIDVPSLTVVHSVDVPLDTFSLTDSGVTQMGWRILFTGADDASFGQTGLISVDPAEDHFGARVPLPVSTSWHTVTAISSSLVDSPSR
jgi:YVTN family beta-propeller protein